MFDVSPFHRNTVDLWRHHANNRSLWDQAFPEWMLERSPYSAGPFEVDVKELDSCYVVEADLPGIRKEDIQVEFDDQFLTIRARRMHTSAPTEEQRGNYLYQERFSGQMTRSFFFDHVHPEGITAGFVDGVLKVTLPKDIRNSSSKKTISIH